MFSAELLLDLASEGTVIAQWAQLIEADLPSAGRHTGASNRPHITLAVREWMDAAALAPAASALPLPVTLGGTLLFGHGGRFVLARQVVVSGGLLALHRRVAEIVGPAEPRYATTRPDEWTPHVTLGRRLSAEQVGLALSVLSADPIEGTAVGLRVWDAVAKVVTDVTV